MQRTEKFVFVAKQYAVRKAKIKMYALRTLKLYKFAVHKGKGVSHSC